MDKPKVNYSLYYYIPWPDSQKWLAMEQQIDDGDIIVPIDEPNVFVSKDLYDFVFDDLK